MIKFKSYKELILQKEFFKAHEALEEYWFPRRKNKTDELLIIKGFINAAVAFELQKRGRHERALLVWQTYLKFAKKITPSQTTFLELKEFIDSYAKSYLFKS